MRKQVRTNDFYFQLAWNNRKNLNIKGVPNILAYRQGTANQVSIIGEVTLFNGYTIRRECNTHQELQLLCKEINKELKERQL